LWDFNLSVLIITLRVDTSWKYGVLKEKINTSAKRSGTKTSTNHCWEQERGVISAIIRRIWCARCYHHLEMSNAQLLNEELLNAEFIFKSNSKLGRLVRHHTRLKNEKNGLYPRFYTLRVILRFIKYLLHIGNLFSPEDKHIVISWIKNRIRRKRNTCGWY
jgi:hypothetical protein